MPLPKLPKSSITGALFTRGGSLVGGQLLPDDGFLTPPAGSVVQNPDQAAKVSVSTGRSAARAGGFGPRSRAAYREYNDPSINPPSQAPGAPISNRPLVPIEDPRGDGGMRGNYNPVRPGEGRVPTRGTNVPGPSLSMASSSGTAFRGATVSSAAPMRSSAGLATRGASVTRPAAAVARTAVAVKPVAAPKATSAVVTGKKVVKKKPIISMA
jgi:hypothetical protein